MKSKENEFKKGDTISTQILVKGSVRTVRGLAGEPIQLVKSNSIVKVCGIIEEKVGSTPDDLIYFKITHSPQALFLTGAKGKCYANECSLGCNFE